MDNTLYVVILFFALLACPLMMWRMMRRTEGRSGKGGDHPGGADRS